MRRVRGSYLCGLVLMLLGCGCETDSRVQPLGSNVVGNELHLACVSYRYHELIGAHTGTISRRRYFRYRIDLLGSGRFAGSSWTVQQLRPAAALETDEVHVVGGDTSWVTQTYDFDRDEYVLRRVDPDTGHVLGTPVRVPGNSSEFQEGRLHLLTASNRKLVVFDRGVATARELVLDRPIDVPGLVEVVRTCYDLCRRSNLLRAYADLSEDLQYLVIWTHKMSDRTDYGRFSVAGREYSFKVYGYYADRRSRAIRPFPLVRDGLRFLTAESVGGSLLMLYGEDDRLLWAPPHGPPRLQARLPPPFRVGWRSGVIVDAGRQRVVVTSGRDSAVATLDLRTGRVRVVAAPSIEQAWSTMTP